MGRKNKAYYKDLHQQAYERLHGMLSFGESKKEAVANGTNQEKDLFLQYLQSVLEAHEVFPEIRPGEIPQMHHTQEGQEVRE